MRKILGLMAVLLVVGPAMAVDFNAPLYQLDGKVFTDEKGRPSEITLGSVAEVALLSVYPDEQNLGGEEKLKRYQLARRIRQAKGDLRLAAEEVALVKRLVAKAYNPLIAGQAWELLDPPQ